MWFDAREGCTRGRAVVPSLHFGVTGVDGLAFLFTHFVAQLFVAATMLVFILIVLAAA